MWASRDAGWGPTRNARWRTSRDARWGTSRGTLGLPLENHRHRLCRHRQDDDDGDGGDVELRHLVSQLTAVFASKRRTKMIPTAPIQLVFKSSDGQCLAVWLYGLSQWRFQTKNRKSGKQCDQIVSNEVFVCGHRIEKNSMGDRPKA